MALKIVGSRKNVCRQRSISNFYRSPFVFGRIVHVPKILVVVVSVRRSCPVIHSDGPGNNTPASIQFTGVCNDREFLLIYSYNTLISSLSPHTARDLSASRQRLFLWGLSMVPQHAMPHTAERVDEMESERESECNGIMHPRHMRARALSVVWPNHTVIQSHRNVTAPKRHAHARLIFG